MKETSKTNHQNKTKNEQFFEYLHDMFSDNEIHDNGTIKLNFEDESFDELEKEMATFQKFFNDITFE